MKTFWMFLIGFKVDFVVSRVCWVVDRAVSFDCSAGHRLALPFSIASSIFCILEFYFLSGIVASRLFP